jgi:hypothetical protein
MKGILVALAFAAAGCGGSAIPGGLAASGTPAQPTATAQPTPEAVTEDCAAALTEFVDGLKSLDSRLDIGLTYADYGEKLGDVKAAYDDVDWKSQDLDCVTGVGTDAETALNHYITAYGTWRDCIQDSDCDTDSSAFTSKLQGEWSDASTLIDGIRDQMP